MLIGVDIGNTNVTVGVLKGPCVVSSFKFETAALASKRKIHAIFQERLPAALRKRRAIEAVYVSSVVTDIMNARFKEAVNSLFEKRVVVVGEDVVVPIVNRYRIPEQVGQDRLIAAYAGLKLYGAGLIIVDFGTAITFDIVSKKSEYLGGLIVAGLKLIRQALHQKTALLPYVELAGPLELIGRDTASSIRSGIVYGAAGLCDGIITRLRAGGCRGFKVVATGGDAALIKPYTASLSVVEDCLVLKGLYFLHQNFF